MLNGKYISLCGEKLESGSSELVVEWLQVFLCEVVSIAHLPLPSEAPVFIRSGAMEGQQRHLTDSRILQ